MTSTSLLMRIHNNLPTKGYMAGIIGEILEKLLIVGITDPGIQLCSQIELHTHTSITKIHRYGKRCYPASNPAWIIISRRLRIFDHSASPLMTALLRWVRLQTSLMLNLTILFPPPPSKIRLLAIPIIGRLAFRNPAYVMPALRKVLHQLLMELGNYWNESFKPYISFLSCRRVQ